MSWPEAFFGAVAAIAIGAIFSKAFDVWDNVDDD